MSKSPANPPKERAFQLFSLSKGAMGCTEIQAQLAAEGFQVKVATVHVWKSRDGWTKKAARGFAPLAFVDLQRALIGPKLAGLQEDERIEALASAGDDLLSITSSIATKLRARLDVLRPKEIDVRAIAPMVESIGRLIGFCAAIDSEVTRRRGDLSRPVTANPDAPGAMTPLQLAAQRLTARRRANQG